MYEENVPKCIDIMLPILNREMEGQYELKRMTLLNALKELYDNGFVIMPKDHTPRAIKELAEKVGEQLRSAPLDRKGKGGG